MGISVITITLSPPRGLISKNRSLLHSRLSSNFLRKIIRGPSAMVLSSVSSITSSLSHLSFSSQLSQLPNTLSFSRRPRNPSLRVHATLEAPEALEEDPEEDFEALEEGFEAPEAEGFVIPEGFVVPEGRKPPTNLMEYIKLRLPGGIANQPINGTGRRKCAIARVILQEGDGKIYINYREAKEYLQGNPLWIQYVKFPLMVLGYENSYDVIVKAHGGGLGGQAQAISLGIARAMLKVSEAHRLALRAEGLLTRDSRIVERKKAGLHKARKAPQYSKR